MITFTPAEPIDEPLSPEVQITETNRHNTNYARVLKDIGFTLIGTLESFRLPVEVQCPNHHSLYPMPRNVFTTRTLTCGFCKPFPMEGNA